MALEVYARFRDGHPFTLEQFSLQRSIRFADEKLSPFAENSVPGDAFPRRCRGHGAAGTAGAARKAQNSGHAPIG